VHNSPLVLHGSFDVSVGNLSVVRGGDCELSVVRSGKGELSVVRGGVAVISVDSVLVTVLDDGEALLDIHTDVLSLDVTVVGTGSVNQMAVWLLDVLIGVVATLVVNDGGLSHVAVLLTVDSGVCGDDVVVGIDGGLVVGLHGLAKHVVPAVVSIFLVNNRHGHVVAEVARVVRVSDVVLFSVEREGLVGDIGVLNWVLGLGLDHVEKLIVLVLDVVLELLAVVVGRVVGVSVACMVGVSERIVFEILICLVMVVVVITAPERSTHVVGVVLVMGALSVDLRLAAPVSLHVVLVLMVGGMHVTSVKNVLVLSGVRVEDLMLVVAMGVSMDTVLGNSHILVMNLTLGITSVETAVLVSPEQLIVGREEGHGRLIDQVTLNTVVVVDDLAMRHNVAILEARIVAGVHVLIGGLIEVANLGVLSDGEVVLNAMRSRVVRLRSDQLFKVILLLLGNRAILK